MDKDQKAIMRLQEDVTPNLRKAPHRNHQRRQGQLSVRGVGAEGGARNVTPEFVFLKLSGGKVELRTEYIDSASCRYMER